jgi:hypothetical protein
VTPGHPLFEAVRDDVQEQVRRDMENGAVYLDLHREPPSRLNAFSAAIKDGRGNVLHRRLFVVEEHAEGSMTIRQPTFFLDLMPATASMDIPDLSLHDRQTVETYLVGEALEPLLQEVTAQREHEIQTISRHMEISLNELIHRQNMRMAELMTQQQNGPACRQAGDSSPLLAANLKTTEDRIDDLNGRIDRRRTELQQERYCVIADIQVLGRAWVLPHPERTNPGVAPFLRDDEIERIAVDAVIVHERAQGREVESVEADNRGFDLISRKPHPEDPKTALEVRFIEVKGRAFVGEVALTTNEYKTAQRLGKDYWLYVVFTCASTPELRIVQDPAQLAWEPLVKIEHYRLAANRLDPHKLLDQ